MSIRTCVINLLSSCSLDTLNLSSSPSPDDAVLPLPLAACRPLVDLLRLLTDLPPAAPQLGSAASAVSPTLEALPVPLALPDPLALPVPFLLLVSAPVALPRDVSCQLL